MKEEEEEEGGGFYHRSFAAQAGMHTKEDYEEEDFWLRPPFLLWLGDTK